MHGLTRRELMKLGAGTCLAIGASSIVGCGHDTHGKSPCGETGPSVVHAVMGDGLENLYEMGGQAAQALGINAGRRLSGTRVFIKPNLFTMGMPFTPYRPSSGEFTKSEILVGIAEQCLLAGADKVTIGDAGQGVRWNWKEIAFFPGTTIFGVTNLHNAVEKLRGTFPNQEIELACLNAVDKWEAIPSSSHDELMRDGLKVARGFCEADHVISVPVIKNHFMADMTCSMKNFVGVVTSMPPFGSTIIRDKVHLAYADATCYGFDKAGISGCFIDICKWRKEAGKEDFAIIDCTIGVEGNGPIAALGLGKPIDLKNRSPIDKYFLLASNDLAAADATAFRITNHDVNTTKQLLMADSLKLGKIHNIALNGASLGQIRIDDWEPLTSRIPEWGPSSTLPPELDWSPSEKGSIVTNTLTGFALPAAAVLFLRHLQKCRKGLSQST